MSYFLDPRFTNSAYTKKEREKARALRKTPWWKEKLQKGVCHYCEKKIDASEITMDHIVPVARGGKSEKKNIVPSCRKCNQEKNLHTPVDLILDRLQKE